MAVGSGGVWKTDNAGITWTPIFDEQPSYSIGEITLDPSNPEVVWVGTGENVSGRHVGWGDGVYRSRDAGQTWQRMGLTRLPAHRPNPGDPRDGNVVLVAAEGPLWSAGGERGRLPTHRRRRDLDPVLAIDENTGVTDLEFDPAQPRRGVCRGLPAPAARRRRSWRAGPARHPQIRRTAEDLAPGHRPACPRATWGRSGSPSRRPIRRSSTPPSRPTQRERGFYRSRDRGESWEKRNELHLRRHRPALLPGDRRLADTTPTSSTRWTCSSTSPTTAARRSERRDRERQAQRQPRHWIDPANAGHLLVGTDAGLYESFDRGEDLAPLPEPAGVAVLQGRAQQRAPFYDILGGTQDLGTLHGPSRTLNRDGIRNQDWYVPLGADGYGVAIDPRDPDIALPEWQEGNLFRADRRSDETLDIRPQPAPGDPPRALELGLAADGEPAHARPDLLRARSTSGAATTAATPGPRSAATSRGTSTATTSRSWAASGASTRCATTVRCRSTRPSRRIGESPLRRGADLRGHRRRARAGHEDGGANWRRRPPARRARRVLRQRHQGVAHRRGHGLRVVDNHKTGDFTPYLLRSDDRGRTWRRSPATCRRGTIVWAIEQDHVKRDLLFVGTEYGIYATRRRRRALASSSAAACRRSRSATSRSIAATTTWSAPLRPRLLRARRLHAAARDRRAALAAKALLFPVKTALCTSRSTDRVERQGQMGETFFTSRQPPVRGGLHSTTSGTG